MNWVGSGFIPILIYQTFSAGEAEATAILTESSLDLMTESSDTLVTE
jgi:hypothetical protein